jgi:flagella basal body P-ring formation protein FlgA
VTNAIRQAGRGFAERTGSARLLCLCCLLAGNLLPHPAAAATSNDGNSREPSGHEQVHQAVSGFLAGFFDSPDAPRAEIDVSRLDPRLQIDGCSRPLETSLNRQQTPAGRVTVRVDCPAPEAPWTRYIQASVQVFEPVVVTTRTLRRGERLTAADISLEERDTSMLRDTVYRDPARAEGMAVRRTVTAGSPLTGNSVTEPVLIQRGDTIAITAENETVSIRHQGVALQNGVLGKRISVRNRRSERVIQATVTGPGQASVAF